MRATRCCAGRSGLASTIRSRLVPSLLEPSNSSHQKERDEVKIDGWLKSVRGHKNVLFAEVNDGSSSEGLQAVFKGDSRVAGLDAGASVRLKGRIVSSKGTGQSQELLVESTEIIGGCDPEVYPIQKKYLPPPVLRDMAHLRFRTTQTASIMRVRDGMMREWHDWFEDNEFFHIHTPLLTSSDCEGAGETFGITAPLGRPSTTPVDSSSSDQFPTTASPSTIPASDPSELSAPASISATASSSTARSPTAPTFFPTPVNLTVSSQLHLECPTLSLSRTYTLSPAFRAEPSMTSRHLCEFYMLEGEVVLDTLDQLMDVVEDGIRSVLTRMLGDGRRAEGMKRDLGAIAGEGETGIDHLTSTAGKVFHRLEYTDAIRELTELHEKEPFESIPDWNEGLPTEHEKWLAEKYGPIFITHYPKHLKPFYMLPSSADPSYSPSQSSSQPQSQETVACFDLLFPGIGELAGGSMREHRLAELEEALDAHGLDKENYGWYLDLRRYGSVPHGGWGMGWDRWISWVTGVGNLRDVVAFPRWKGNCKY